MKRIQKTKGQGRHPGKPRRRVRHLAPVEHLEPRRVLAANPVVTELLADNDGVLLDADGDAHDWIEIRNLGDQSIDLEGWYLSDDIGQPTRWEFPQTIVDANASLVIFASDKNRADAGFELHTNFTLDRSGEQVFLVEPDGVTIRSEISPFPYLPENVSFGRASNGSLGYFTNPTPGSANGVATLETGAIITEVSHSPQTPTDTDDIVITATVDRSSGTPSSVSLNYRVGYGTVATVAMNDTGVGDDAVAGDGIYTATLGASLHDPGEMIRWSVSTEMSGGTVTRMPLWDTSVIDRTNAPEYFGTVTTDASINSNLPVLHWFLQPGTENAAGTSTGTRASVFFDGEFYDNVFVRVRGASTSRLNKKSYKIDFNQGYHFEFDSRYDRVSEINLNTTFPDKAYVRQPLTFEVYDAVGAAGSISFPMRIQRNGAFFSIAAFIEQPDEDLLAREGLDPEGALYKMYNPFTSSTNVEKKTRQDEGNSDLANFISGMNASGSSLVNFTFDNVDIPAVINYLVGTVLTQNNDQQSKNYFLYRDTNGTGEWQVLPWDLDLTFGRHYMTRDNILDDELWADGDNILGGRNDNTPISPSHPYVGEQDHPGNRNWNRLIDSLYEMPEFREMYLRRLRSAMDELLQAPGTPYADRWMESRIDAMVAEIGNDATLDFQEWADPWSYGANLSITQAVNELKQDYLDIRRTHLYVTHGLANLGQPDVVGIPNAQVTQPIVNFGAYDASPVSGNQNEEFIELVNPGNTAIDLSGWQLTGGVRYTFRPGTVIRANSSLYVAKDVPAFRARSTGPGGGQGLFVQGDYEGNLSASGETIELVRPDASIASLLQTPDTRSNLEKFLRITELNYNPTVPNDGSEFIEIQNIGTTGLNLSGATITEGPSTPFVFPSGTGLAAGQYGLIVADAAVFQATYPSVNPNRILGTYAGALSNSGETISIDDADGRTVVQVTWSDDDPWPRRADGDGATLELNTTGINEDTPVDKYYYWRASSEWGGSPAAPGIGSLGVVINEVLSNSDTHPDTIELKNISQSSVSLDGWYLSDSATNLLKFPIPAGTLIEPGEILVFDEQDFNPNPANPGPNDFALNGSLGDDVWLTIADGVGGITHFVDDVEFGPALEDHSFTRVFTSIGQTQTIAPLIVSQSPSPGCENRGHLASPLVLSELNYNAPAPRAEELILDPALSANDLDYVEITNQSPDTINLDAWRIRGGIQLDFESSTTIAPDASALLVGFDTTNTDRMNAFRLRYGLDSSTQIIGNFSGNISNSGEPIRLDQRDSSQTDMPFVIADEIRFDDLLPWGVGADGNGQSLHRRYGLSYGNNPAAWTALAPTPGTASLVLPANGDLDGDGVLTPADIDWVGDAIANGNNLPALDFNGDSTVDQLDIDYYIEQSVGIIQGDANLDGLVDSVDFDAWNAHRFGPCGSWATGDFNGDRFVDVSDFNIWNTGKTVSEQSAASTSVRRLSETAYIANEDVNADGTVSPLDALQVLNYLNRDAPSTDPGRMDVDGSGVVTPLDALWVINHLNALPEPRVDLFFATFDDSDREDEDSAEESPDWHTFSTTEEVD